MKKIVLSYLGVFVIFTAVYILFFQTNIFSFQKVLFYKGLLLLALTSALCFIGIILYAKLVKGNFESLFAALVISFALNLTFFVVFPVTFERSVTMFILSSIDKGNMNNSCRGLTKGQIETELINKYILENRAVDKRINEQEIIKTLESKSQCVQLTKEGSNFLKFSAFISKTYHF